MTNSIPSTLELSTSSEVQTNAIPSTSEPPCNPPVVPPMGGGASWTMPMAVIAAVGIVLLIVGKLKARLAKFEESVKGELIDDILDAVANGASDRAALRAELAAAVAGAGNLRTEPLCSILRIEESYEKLSSGKYLRRVSVLRRKEGVTGIGSLTKIEKERGWEYIPADVRDRFIAVRDSKVVRLVYDAERKQST